MAPQVVHSYISPKIKLKKSKVGKGLFANSKIKKNELVVDFDEGPGQFIPRSKADQLYDRGLDYMIQVDDDLFFAAVTNEEIEDVDFINHSCNPNCGIRGSLKIVAIRDINAGEEITFDYAMCESSEYEIVCKCEAKKCRKVVTGDDWKLEGLQEKYKEYFSDYIKKKLTKETYL